MNNLSNIDNILAVFNLLGLWHKENKKCRISEFMEFVFSWWKINEQKVHKWAKWFWIRIDKCLITIYQEAQCRLRCAKSYLVATWPGLDLLSLLFHGIWLLPVSCAEHAAPAPGGRDKLFLGPYLPSFPSSLQTGGQSVRPLGKFSLL